MGNNRGHQHASGWQKDGWGHSARGAFAGGSPDSGNCRGRGHATRRQTQPGRWRLACSPASHAVMLRGRVDALLPLAPVEERPNSSLEAAAPVEFPTGRAMAPRPAGQAYGRLVWKEPADRDAIERRERSPAIGEGLIAHRPRIWSICLEKNH